MKPTICVLGGCNGAGKTTLARELLPRMGLMRFLNADEIARGLSPLDASLAAFKAGRLLLEEAKRLVAAGESFALESTLSGKTYVRLFRAAKEAGFRIVLHYIVIGSAKQAVDRVRLRVLTGGHHVPEEDVRRRFARSVDHFLNDYVTLADEWVVWDNVLPPLEQIAGNETHCNDELAAMLDSTKVKDFPPVEMTSSIEMVLEASRVATEKMLDYYRRMDIKVTPEMTLAEDSDEGT